MQTREQASIGCNINFDVSVRQLLRAGSLLSAYIFAVPMATHDELWKIVKKLPSDFEPYGQRNRDTDEPSEDCSCDCIHFAKLEGKLGYDWGVCAKTQKVCASALLTFEHIGCPEFEAEENTALS